MNHSFLCSLVILTGCLITHADETNRLNPHRLLEFREQGVVRAVTNENDWQLRRAEILRGIQHVMGPLPGKRQQVNLDPKIVNESTTKQYVRRLITYQSDLDCRTPAYLCIPKDVLAGTRKAKAVLCLHPTDNQVGHKVVVGLGGRPGRQYAAELAERGYITLSPAYPHLANYWPNLGKLQYTSGSMKAIWDNIRGLDLLSTMNEVDKTTGFGCIGHSLGGHNGLFTAVFDRRIKIVVTSCGFDSFADYYDGNIKNWFFGKGWCQIRYMPRLSDYRGRLHEIPFDFPEILAAIAPRAVFISAPKHDGNFRWQSVEKCVNSARPVFGLLGDASRLVVEYPDSDHNFPPEIREQAYRKIDQVLKTGPID